MRQVMNEVPPVYASSVALGQPMPGGTVNRIVASRHPQHHVGLLDIGQPRAGETVVVAAATGAVGTNVGQIAKIKGARVVGIAGGADKCRYAVEELGFDACLDRRDPQFAQRLADACPKGIDVYFENVGGAVFDAVLPLLNIGARVPVCGHIADYNAAALPTGPNRLPLLLATVLQKRIRMQGFIILDHYGDRFEGFPSGNERMDRGACVHRSAGRSQLRQGRGASRTFQVKQTDANSLHSARDGASLCPSLESIDDRRSFR
jgi:NADPH-dependent curcumin reductase CurA